MFTSFGDDYSGDESDDVPENQSFEHTCMSIMFVSAREWFVGKTFFCYNSD